MIRYILQNDSDALDVEYVLIKEQLKRNKLTFEFTECVKDKITETAKKCDIPIGDIKFVEKFLLDMHGIEKENPIEIPKYLRTEEFLKRDYRITTWDKIPREGTFFLKDVSKLKSFSGEVNATYTDIDELFKHKAKGKMDTTLVLNKEHLFQVSELYDILSEYRVYICSGRIEAIVNYNGDATVLPDVNLIKKAVALIQYHEKWLKSYTIDIMVGHKGTAIVEIHNFTSIGLYSTLWGSSLIYAYRDGIDYLLNDNRPIEV